MNSTNDAKDYGIDFNPILSMLKSLDDDDDEDVDFDFDLDQLNAPDKMMFSKSEKMVKS